jgi:hypothetical protein
MFLFTIDQTLDGWVDLIKDKIPQLPNVTSLAVKVHPMSERHSLGDGVVGLLTRFNSLSYLSLQLDEEFGWMIRRVSKLNDTILCMFIILPFHCTKLNHAYTSKP